MPHSVKPQSANSYIDARGAQNISDVTATKKAAHPDNSNVTATQKAARRDDSDVTTTQNAARPNVSDILAAQKATRPNALDILTAKKAARPNTHATSSSPEITPPRRKAPPPRKAPSRSSGSITGSPLLDSFATSAQQETIFIPNYQLVGNRFGDRQRNNFQNIALKFSGISSNGSRPKQRLNSTGSKIAGVASHNRPATQAPNLPTSKISDQNGVKGTAPATTNARPASPPEIKQIKPVNKGHSYKTPIAQPASEIIGQPAQAPSHQASSRQAPSRREPLPSTSPSQKTQQKTDQNTRPKTHQNPRQQTDAPNPSTYSSAQYRASQARAAAGGLVDLEDTLLFGGAEKNTPLSVSNTPPRTKSSTSLLEYLIRTQPPAFVLTKPEGNRAILDDFRALERPDLIRVHTVLNAKNFVVFDPPAKRGELAQHPNQQNEPQNANELNGLTQQIRQLHQKIEYLSEKLASLNGTHPQDHMPSQE